jgi:hypothetical protein
MQGNGQHIVALVKNALGAIAVVHVDVEYGDALMLFAQDLRGYRTVVQVAKSTGKLAACVVSWRSGKRVAGRRAVQNFQRRMHGAPGTPAGTIPGVRGDRRRAIEYVVADLTHRRLWVHDIPCVRMHVGSHVRRSAGDTLPAGVNILEESQVAQRVHCGQRFQTVITRRFTFKACGNSGLQQGLSATRTFGAVDQRAG